MDMSNLNTQAEQARESARRDDGKFGSYESGESGATLVPNYTSAGAQALQRIGADKPAIEAVEEPQTEDPGPVSQEDFGDVRAGIEGTLKDDLRMSYNDGAFSADGEPPSEEIDELELDEDSSGKLEDLTEDFMSNNYADLKTFAEATGQDMNDVGADAYLSGSGHGSRFRDRVPNDQAIAAQHLENLERFEKTSGTDHGDELNRALDTTQRSGVEPVTGESGYMDVKATLRKVADGEAPSAKARQAAERLDDAAEGHFRTTFESAEIGDDGKIHL